MKANVILKFRTTRRLFMFNSLISTSLESQRQTRTTRGIFLVPTRNPSLQFGPEVSGQIIALQDEGFLRFFDSLMVSKSYKSYNKHIQNSKW